MEIDQFFGFKFDRILFEGCQILCPECENYSMHTGWTSTEVYCEDCGTHEAIECPNCNERFDHVYADEFKVR